MTAGGAANSTGGNTNRKGCSWWLCEILHPFQGTGQLSARHLYPRNAPTGGRSSLSQTVAAFFYARRRIATLKATRSVTGGHRYIDAVKKLK